MGYVGNQTTTSFTSMDKQTITGSGATTYTLSHNVSSESEIEVFVNNIRQEGGSGKAYTVSANQITFSEAVASSDSIYVVFQGKAIQTVVPPDGSVSSAKLATNIAVSGDLDVAGNLDVGTIRATNGTTAMTIDSTGRILTPARPAFSVFYNSSGTEGVTGTVIFTGVHSNIGSHYNTSTGIFTCPVSGFYQFNLNAFGSGASNGATISANGQIVAQLYDNTNSVVLAVSYGHVTSSAFYPNVSFGSAHNLAANTEVKILIGSGEYLYSDATDKYLKFSGFLIG